MRNAFALFTCLLLPGLFLDNSATPGQHRITLTGNPETRKFVFSPAQVTASAGDTLSFVVESGGPHALGFIPEGMPESVRDAWNRAMPRKVGNYRGPLLRDSQRYVIVIPARTPAGRYLFFCLAHRAYDMRLVVEIK